MDGTMKFGGSLAIGAWPPKCPEHIASLADLPDAPLIVPNVDMLKMLADPDRAASEEIAEWRAGNWEHYLETLDDVAYGLKRGITMFFGSLYLRKVTADGDVLDYGLVSHRTVTTAFRGKIVDGLHTGDTTTYQNFKYHGIGEGSTAENAGDTDLDDETAADLLVPNTRATGNQGEGANAQTYRTSAVITVGAVASALSIVEHGVFSSATVGSGTLMDRSMFSGSPISLDDNQSAQATYDLSTTGS